MEIDRTIVLQEDCPGFWIVKVPAILGRDFGEFRGELVPCVMAAKKALEAHLESQGVVPEPPRVFRHLNRPEAPRTGTAGAGIGGEVDNRFSPGMR